MKRRDRLSVLVDLLLEELREHIFDVAKLHAFRANREIDAGEHEQRNKNVGIHEVIDVARYQNEKTVDTIRLHRVFFLEKYENSIVKEVRSLYR